MNKLLFMHIVNRLSNEVDFFRQKRDSLGRLGLSTLQKCTAAIRVLAYGTAADAVDEYLRLGPKAVLFAQHQEAVRKDVERAFGVLQARFAIVKNPALFWDKVKIGKIMRACIILHNMIVEDERDGYSQFDLSDFQHGEDNGSSHVDLTYSTDIPTNIANMMGVRTRLRDRQMHEQVKGDLVEHVWRRFGGDENNQ
uniref:DDE Tnp4 domain-containing protein n=1 Tax=Brassica oleracea var. oleracea TaxID=109376 RepID=A0A0D3BP26_BRAOL